MKPTIKNLQQYLNLDEEKSKLIYSIINSNIDQYEKEEKLNSLLNFYGSEIVRSTKLWNYYYCDIAFIYLNAGDIYNTTLIYDVEKRKWILADLGSIIEKRKDLI